MRLKLFEEYSGTYYQILDSGYDFLEAEYDRIEMSDNTINSIKNLFVGWNTHIVSSQEFIYLWQRQLDEKTYGIKIFEVEDQYFYCHINNYNKDITDYYKCDQLEGLIKLVKNKELI